MAGFSAILGGAMEGWSNAKLDQIKADREERLKELEQQRADDRLASDQEFRSREAAIGDARQVTENKRQEGVKAIEAQKTRDAPGDLITDDQGNTLVRTGSTAKPLVDDKGKPIKQSTAGQGKFEIDRRYQMLIAAGMEEKKAAKIAAGEKMPGEMDIANLVEKQLGTEGYGKESFGTPSDDDLAKIRARRAELTDSYRKLFGQDAGDQSPDSGVEGPGDVIPSDPTKRVVGKVYKAPNGKIAKWTGQGWELIQ